MSERVRCCCLVVAPCYHLYLYLIVIFLIPSNDGGRASYNAAHLYSLNYPLGVLENANGGLVSRYLVSYPVIFGKTGTSE
mgnify:CR=1 FL=1